MKRSHIFQNHYQFNRDASPQRVFSSCSCWSVYWLSLLRACYYQTWYRSTRTLAQVRPRALRQQHNPHTRVPFPQRQSQTRMWLLQLLPLFLHRITRQHPLYNCLQGTKLFTSSKITFTCSQVQWVERRRYYPLLAISIIGLCDRYWHHPVNYFTAATVFTWWIFLVAHQKR